MRPWLCALLGLLFVACDRGSTGQIDVTHTTGAVLGADAGMSVQAQPIPATHPPAGSSTGVGSTRAPGPAGDAGSRFEHPQP